MKLGIIGKPQSGKTTLFNAAAGQQVVVGDFSQAVHRAVIKVPDERLTRLAEIAQPGKMTHAEIEFLDATGFTGKGKQAAGLEITPDLRLMDAFIMVIDAFSERSNPELYIQNLTDEMILLDQAVIENNLEKRERKIKLTGDKSGVQEMDLLRRCLALLEDERPLIELDLNKEDEKKLRGYQFLTCKPRLIVLNIDEDSIGKRRNLLDRYAHFVAPGKQELAVICAKIEMELVTLDEQERIEFMKDLGIDSPAVQKVIRKAYGLLGLISFLTLGPTEVRAWPVERGTIAARAAGTVHTDMERGFIRAEVVRYDDYVEYQTPAALKAAGKMRLEGKEYVVDDGDIILFRFNV